jgi:hypothetical protein
MVAHSRHWEWAPALSPGDRFLLQPRYEDASENTNSKLVLREVAGGEAALVAGTRMYGKSHRPFPAVARPAHLHVARSAI